VARRSPRNPTRRQHRARGQISIEIASKFVSGDRPTYATQVTDKFNELTAPKITAPYLPTTFDAIIASIVVGIPAWKSG
jgi:hypothetical protein